MPTQDRTDREILDAILSVSSIEEFTLYGGVRPVKAWRLFMERPIVIDGMHADRIRDRMGD